MFSLQKIYICITIIIINTVIVTEKMHGNDVEINFFSFGNRLKTVTRLCTENQCFRIFLHAIEQKTLIESPFRRRADSPLGPDTTKWKEISRRQTGNFSTSLPPPVADPRIVGRMYVCIRIYCRPSAFTSPKFHDTDNPLRDHLFPPSKPCTSAQPKAVAESGDLGE